ncbi:response regulator [Roseococcus suduntuyensis]|uniref:CheY-like chemotaxis protein n=1 Tax=Roseococcus suduntuyensis TaxID=455361 RepID=A0A840AFI3_9PROT|nr:response regulator [Roseococcus suduntuyensis]MBB3899662.1 CheY-like chemotaxis protein [Roseococcus suduntuyensis]
MSQVKDRGETVLMQGEGKLSGRVARAADDTQGGVEPPRGRVLIVEDEFFVAMDAEDSLTAAGFTVIGIAATADAAVNLAESQSPDIVLMDIRLVGRRDGIDAAAEIRERFGIPCVFATAHSDPTTRHRAEVAAAPLGWLSKPYTRAEVTNALGRALQRYRQERG